MPRRKKEFYNTAAKQGASSPMGAVAMAGLAATGKMAKSRAQRIKQDSPEPPKEVFRYDSKPLRSPRTGVAPIQSNIVQADPKNPEPAIKQNLDNAIKLIDGTMLWR